MISAEIVTDSVSEAGKRITTFKLKYPRFIHAEFMTHRVFSRNASSSRAIPVNKQIEEIKNNWATPVDFRRNKRGMQGGDILQGAEAQAAFDLWAEAKDNAIEYAQKFVDLDIHKQYANRILEPFSHISVVVTATEWDNFFALRCHHMAQPEINVLATKMYDLMQANTPQELKISQWHMPFVRVSDMAKILVYCDNDNILPQANDLALKMSIARCARVSYNNHDGSETTLEQDLKLYNRLLGNQPIHASPAEHQGMAVADTGYRSGNFVGWKQYRKTLEGENVEKFTPGELE